MQLYWGWGEDTKSMHPIVLPFHTAQHNWMQFCILMYPFSHFHQLNMKNVVVSTSKCIYIKKCMSAYEKRIMAHANRNYANDGSVKLTEENEQWIVANSTESASNCNHVNNECCTPGRTFTHCVRKTCPQCLAYIHPINLHPAPHRPERHHRIKSMENTHKKI